MAPKKTSARATKKVTKRPAKATKANSFPSVTDMNTLVKSNTTKRDRALIALATVSALGAAGAACGSSQRCTNAVRGTAEDVGRHLRQATDTVKKAGESVGQTMRGMGLIRKPKGPSKAVFVTSGSNPGVFVTSGPNPGVINALPPLERQTRLFFGLGVGLGLGSTLRSEANLVSKKSAS
jgi:hypothetical protein